MANLVMEKTMKDKIFELIKHLSAYEKVKSYKRVTALFGRDEDDEKESKAGEPKLEGIGFRYKTVQYHLIDDTFEEIKKHPEFFGDVEIYSERFSLPGWGKETEDFSSDEYQFEITALIKSNTDKETYFNELNKVLSVIEQKHSVDIVTLPTEKYYNVNYITFHTAKEGVFSKE